YLKILVINSGSSSIKYRLFQIQNLSCLAHGLIERIGEPGSRSTHYLFQDQREVKKTVSEQFISGHGEGIRQVFTVLVESGCLQHTTDLLGIGHRVVHGG